MVEGSIVVKNVSKVYGEGKGKEVEVNALDNVSFSLNKGEFVAIVGPSGSGKSTLMHIIGTIDKPTSGEVLIDGVETSGLKGDVVADFRRTKLGFIFQSFNLVSGLNAEENVMLPLVVEQGIAKAEKISRAEVLLRRLGLGERLKLKPTQLSGGEQQRVAVARALINNPTLILADEPTGNLDTKSGEEVMRLFKEISRERNVTIVLVTHNPDITEYCDKVIHIKDGKLEKIDVRR